MFRNILVPFDDSLYSKRAFKVALDIAKKYKSKINLLTCLTHADTGAGYSSVRFNKEIFETAKKITENKLLKLKEVAKNENIQVKVRVIGTETIVKQIVDFAKANKIDLIVMGSHGRTGWKKMLLGSVTNGVSQQVKCPILIIKQ